jgi:hypothetical protein
MSTIEQLQQNGYLVGERDECLQILAAAPDEFIYNTSADFRADRKNWLKGAPSLAVLKFEASHATAMSYGFSEALVALLMPKATVLRKHGPPPLCRKTPKTLEFVYRAEGAVRMNDPQNIGHQMFEHGLAISDAPQYSSASLVADFWNVALDGGEWVRGASPVTVPRDALPAWDANAVAAQLQTLVNQFAERGEIRVYEPYREPPRKPAFEYGSPDISVDPRDWDPADPRRNLPGFADEVQRLRRKVLGREPRPGELIEGRRV